MCIAYLRFQPGAQHPLIVVANRDEFHARPTKMAHFWADHPGLLAGRDLQAGGTWLGVYPQKQRFALVTNFREPQQKPPKQAISRGQLVQDFLIGEADVEHYLAQLQGQKNAYAGFNLLVAQGLTQTDAVLGYFSNRSAKEPQLLSAGDYVLSNHLLNSPWPKTKKLAHHMDLALRSEPKTEALFTALYDTEQAPIEEQPNTGLSAELEARLSSIFIMGSGYGTRCSTVFWVDCAGRGLLAEQSFNAQGQTTDRIDWPLEFGVS